MLLEDPIFVQSSMQSYRLVTPYQGQFPALVKVLVGVVDARLAGGAMNTFEGGSTR
jgi:hypothetical protein